MIRSAACRLKDSWSSQMQIVGFIRPLRQKLGMMRGASNDSIGLFSRTIAQLDYLCRVHNSVSLLYMFTRLVILSVTVILHFLQTAAANTNSPFKIEERGGISWLIKPDGQPFFSLGVCVVNQG